MAATANSLKIWDLMSAGSKEVQTLAGPSGFVWGVAFSPDSVYLATSSMDGQVIIWDWAAGKRLLELTGHEGAVQDIRFSPNGMLLATAGRDSTARLWDATNGRELFTLRGHDQGSYRPFFEGIMELAFSPDGTSLATAGLDDITRVWDARTGELLLTLLHNSPVKSVSFSPDGTILLTADSDQTFHLWDANTGRELFAVSTPAEVLYVTFSPDGRWLGASIRDTSIKIWAVDTLLNAGQDTTEVAGDELALLTLTGQTDIPWWLGFSQDGARLASVSSVEIRVWDANTGQALLSLPAGESPYATSASFSPDGRYLAAGKADGTVRIFVLPIEELVALAQSRLTRGWAVAECIKYHIDPCPSEP
jgi:WD40 repeat protein